MVGVVGVTISSLIGMTLGLAAGYFGRWTNNIIMRIMDAQMAIPGMILMLVISTVLGGGLRNVMIALGVAMVPVYCRMMCGQVLAMKESDYVTAAHSIGTNNIIIILRHILPNSFAPILVLMTMGLGLMILMEANLSFLGVGISPPTPSWGSMVNDGYKYLFTNPLLSLSPGIAIGLVVLGFNMAGDGLRDALDPKLRGTL